MRMNKKRKIFLVFLVMMTVLLSAVFVFAADPAVPPANTADSAWSGIWGVLTTWIMRIGAGIALFGGVNIGISFASDNPDARVRGLQFLAAGLIVAAVGAAPNIFGVV